MKYCQGEYKYYLNSEDLKDDNLPLQRNRCKGGTLVMWKKGLDPYLKVCPPDTTSYLPNVLEIPGVETMIHVCLYLPTAGKESDFLSDLAKFKMTMMISRKLQMMLQSS